MEIIHSLDGVPDWYGNRDNDEQHECGEEEEDAVDTIVMGVGVERQEEERDRGQGEGGMQWSVRRSFQSVSESTSSTERYRESSRTLDLHMIHPKQHREQRDTDAYTGCRTGWHTLVESAGHGGRGVQRSSEKRAEQSEVRLPSHANKCHSCSSCCAGSFPFGWRCGPARHWPDRISAALRHAYHTCLLK